MAFRRFDRVRQLALRLAQIFPETSDKGSVGDASGAVI
jgi:hypothetical protein